MPNKPSKQLIAYLEATGAINGTPESIAMAKLQYIRDYKKRWKNTAKKNKEIRASFTQEEYSFIKQVSNLYGMTPTEFVRQLALKGTTDIIPHRDDLLLILQKLHLACITCMQEKSASTAIISEAEQLLIRYLQKK